MRKGDIVTVYQDPITKEKVDGEARLVKRIPMVSGPEIEQWEVVFLDDGMRTIRLISN